ncbi:nidogen-2 [Ambystoma mexicanum]|uniref:nidogen-2 n=1 Tax=Ambystoma mexicanum TaxID=8296 RepID=UPI0037E9A9FC
MWQEGSRLASSLLLLHCLLCPVASISRQELFPFGTHRGDRLLQEGDDETSEVVLLQKPLLFYEAEFNNLYVGTNGLISTQDFPRETQYVDDGFPTDFPAIAPFLSDVDTGNGKGKIFYRQDTSDEILGRAAHEVRRGFPQAAFHPTAVFLATWENVGKYEELTRLFGPSNQFNTFQAVIAYDDADAYAIFLYPEDGIQFFGTRPKESYNVQIELPARVGFSRGEVGIQKNEGPFYSITSSEQSVKDLYQKSNVRIPGVWVFHIGSVSQMDNVVPAGADGNPSDVKPAVAPEGAQSNEGEDLYPDLSNENVNYPESLYDGAEEDLEYPLPRPTDFPPRAYAPSQDLPPSNADVPIHLDHNTPNHEDQFLSRPDSEKDSFLPFLLSTSPREDIQQEAERGSPISDDGLQYRIPVERIPENRGDTFAPPPDNLPSPNEPVASYPDGGAVTADMEIFPVYPERGVVLPPSQHGRSGDEQEVDVRVESDVYTYQAARKDSCEVSHGQCSQHAFCTDYSYGFCCHCQSEYYGNGRYCLPKGAPHRVNGKVSGRVIVDGALVEFSDVDLHAYIVLNDGRAYTAISHIPSVAARGLMPLSPIGGLFGWLFSLEKPGYENGFSITGAKFTHNIDVIFYPGEEKIQVTQTANGLDAQNYLNVKTTIKGQVPFIPEEATVQMEPYNELYHYSGSVVTSTARREYSVNIGGEAKKYSYRLQQNITYEDCIHDQRVPPSTQKLHVDRVFVLYSKEERVLRYAMTNHIGSVQDSETTDPTLVNPCYDGTHACDTTARCKPGAGLEYTCECATGFQGDGRDCVDVDECVAGFTRCSAHSLCLNLPGSYRCECEAGYEFAGDGHTCVVIPSPTNPCEDGRNNCAPSDVAQCISHGDGTFRCVCRPGYTGSGYQCTDMDECSAGLDRCGPNSLCLNLPGRYRCSCQAGYELHTDEHSCILISPSTNPCQDGSHDCDSSAQCISHGDGSYRCACLPGYTGDGQNCTDVDECREGRCHADAACYNTPGSFACRCRPGYEGNGFQCTLRPSPIQTQCQQQRDQLQAGFGPRGPRPPVGAHVPQCDSEGNYTPQQCHGSTGECWCVDTNGREIAGTRTRPGSPPHRCGVPAPTQKPQTVCERWRQSLLEHYGGTPTDEQYIPQCDAYGNFNPLQCHGNSGYCWCVDKDGREVQGTRKEPGMTPACIPTIAPPTMRPEPRTDVTPPAEGTYLMYAQGQQIGVLPLNGTRLNKATAKTLLSLHGSIVVGIDYDCKAKMVYWTDVAGRTISRASLEPGAEPEIIINSGLMSPEGLAIDYNRRTMFWTDSGLDRIESAELDGSGRKVLFDTDLVNPRAITVDSVRGNLYWTDWNREAPKIETSFVDGSNRRILVNEDIGLPNGLTYDPFSKQLCWADAGTKKLECMLPNGTGRRLVLSNLNYPFSVVCYANHIYHTDWRRDGVISVNKDTGRLTEEYLPEQRSHLYGITAVHPYCPSGRK